MKLETAKPFLDILKERIESGLSGSSVTILDPRRDGVHLEAVVVWSGFVEMSLIDRHRKVYACVQDLLDSGELHALAIKTKVE
jgi:stress-induced morphogen